MGKVKPTSRDLKISIRGMSFGSLLFLILMTLKLTGYITASWWIVTAPLWIGFAIILAIILVVSIFIFGTHLIGQIAATAKL